jgi:hypothetical protein
MVRKNHLNFPADLHVPEVVGTDPGRKEEDFCKSYSLVADL